MQIDTLQKGIDTLQSAGCYIRIEIHRNLPANLYFGGRQFAFWRLKLSWGCFLEKGGPPQKGGTLASAQTFSALTFKETHVFLLN